MKKFLYKLFLSIFITFALITNSISILKAEEYKEETISFLEGEIKNDLSDKTHKYEVYYSQPIEFEYCINFAAETIPSYITGTYDIGNETITFGIKNIDNVKFIDLSDTIVDFLYDVICQNHETTKKFEIDRGEVRIQKVDYLDNEVNINTIKKVYSNDLESIQGTFDIEIQKQLVPFTENNINIEDFTLNSENSLYNALSAVRGGPSYPDIVGTINPLQAINTVVNPYKGDRQDRAKLKQRFNRNDDMNTYFWWPSMTTTATSGAKCYSTTEYYNSHAVQINFTWNAERLSNLVVDSNEAIEIEALFYNYGPNSTIPGDGSAWMMDEPDYWVTTLPNAYLDTRFMDSGDEKSYAIGTAHPENIKANTQYYVQFMDIGMRRGTSRLWSVNYQRGYYYDHPNLLYRAYRGSGDEWFVFNEEYESGIKVKQYHKYNTAYYAPELPTNVTPSNNILVSFADLSIPTFRTAYRYMESFKTVTSGDVKSAVNNLVRERIQINSGGNYAVYRFQVNESATYSFYTSSSIGPQNTYMLLTDHNFNNVAQNINADGTNFSRITEFLLPGDYYVLVRPFTETFSIDCYLNFAWGGRTIQ